MTEETTAQSEPQSRNDRRSLIGTISTRTGDKSVKVVFAYKVPHPRYIKEINRKTVVHAHDESNECAPGDRVEIMETRPLSKLKRFRVIRIIEKAPVIG